MLTLAWPGNTADGFFVDCGTDGSIWCPAELFSSLAGTRRPSGVLREFMTKPLVIDFQLGGSEKALGCSFPSPPLF